MPITYEWEMKSSFLYIRVLCDIVILALPYNRNNKWNRELNAQRQSQPDAQTPARTQTQHADTGPDPDTDNYHQVLIIGGGISGLSAASHLAKNGFKDFRLLEARNRLGGRIATMQIGG